MADNNSTCLPMNFKERLDEHLETITALDAFCINNGFDNDKYVYLNVYQMF